MKWYLCYEAIEPLPGGGYTREVRDWGKAPYDTEEDAEDACSYWKSLDTVTYKDMFVYPM